MKLLYCARCTTPLMSAATVLVCPCCGAAYRQRGTRFSFVADLSGVSVKELMNDLEFAATVFCVTATNAIILFVVYLICGTLESGTAALLFFILGCFVFPFESRILDFLEERKHEKK